MFCSARLQEVSPFKQFCLKRTVPVLAVPVGVVLMPLPGGLDDVLEVIIAWVPAEHGLGFL